jgi:hypothetical protein
LDDFTIADGGAIPLGGGDVVVLGCDQIGLGTKNGLNQISMIGAGRLMLKLIMLQLMKSHGKTASQNFGKITRKIDR